MFISFFYVLKPKECVLHVLELQIFKIYREQPQRSVHMIEN